MPLKSFNLKKLAVGSTTIIFKISKTFILLIILQLAINKQVYSQDYKEYLSEYWDSFYDKNPSSIESSFTASDFISVIDLTMFVPKRKELMGDVNLFKKALFSFSFEALRQMSITGNFYSRTKKHDDYYNLYNLTYKKITKEQWDKHCPYLIPLMEIDGIIKLR